MPTDLMTPPAQAATTAQYLHLQLTERCNLACPGCYLPERAGRGKSAGEIEARVFAPLAAAGVRYATLTGGEPLLHPQWLEICAAAVRHFQDVQLVSNGLLLSVERYEALRQAGLRAVKVSLDGPTAGVHDLLRGKAGAFEQVTANLRAICALPAERRGDIDLGCICTVHPENVRLLGDIAAFAQELGLDSLLFQPFHPFGMLYPESGQPVARPVADGEFLAVLGEQVEALRSLRRARPGFLDNSLDMLAKFMDFYTATAGPSQVCGADRFVFVNSALQVRGCLFCEPLGELGAAAATLDGGWLSGFRQGAAWAGFDRFRRGCTRCLMGCQFVDKAKELADTGFEFLAAEDPAAARTAFDASLALEYSPVGGHGAGLARLRLGQAAEARPLLEQALEHLPRDRFALCDLGEALLRLEAWDELDGMWERLSGLGLGKAALLRILADVVRAEDAEGAADTVQQLQTVLEGCPEEAVFVIGYLGDRGDELLRRQAWAGVESMAACLAQLPLGRGKAAHLRGLACLRQGAVKAAVDLLRQALEHTTDAGPWPSFEYGLACLQDGRFEEAERHIRIAAERDPSFPWFRFRLAQALVGLGRRAEAMAWCRAALRLDAGPKPFHDLLDELLGDLPTDLPGDPRGDPLGRPPA